MRYFSQKPNPQLQRTHAAELVVSSLTDRNMSFLYPLRAEEPMSEAGV